MIVCGRGVLAVKEECEESAAYFIRLSFVGTELYSEGIDCGRYIDESVIGWGDKLCQTGGAGRRGMLGQCVRAARRVVFARGACAPWPALLKTPPLACL